MSTRVTPLAVLKPRPTTPTTTITGPPPLSPTTAWGATRRQCGYYRPRRHPVIATRSAARAHVGASLRHVLTGRRQHGTHERRRRSSCSSGRRQRRRPGPLLLLLLLQRRLARAAVKAGAHCTAEARCHRLSSPHARPQQLRCHAE